MLHSTTDPGLERPSWLRLFKRKAPCGEALREAVEGYIEEAPQAGPAASDERTMLGNILKLRDLTAADVAVPRADIVAVDRGMESGALLAFLAEKGYSRLPVYSGTLDDVAGILHVKDVLAVVAAGGDVRVEDLIRPAQIIAPSMPVLDLLAEMRRSRRHMALVVDEFGGIDGLVTIGDIIEAIVGETADEHDHAEVAPHMAEEAGGAILADARVPVEEFEGRFGALLTEEERSEVDTLGGLVFFLTGRVPSRGEIITHTASGALFEVVEADPRCIGTLRITGLPSPSAAVGGEEG